MFNVAHVHASLLVSIVCGRLSINRLHKSVEQSFANLQIVCLDFLNDRVGSAIELTLSQHSIDTEGGPLTETPQRNQDYLPRSDLLVVFHSLVIN